MIDVTLGQLEFGEAVNLGGGGNVDQDPTCRTLIQEFESVGDAMIHFSGQHDDHVGRLRIVDDQETAGIGGENDKNRDKYQCNDRDTSF